MNVAITGASGFIGRRLTEHLQKSGHTVRAISMRKAPRPEDLRDLAALVNLAGEPVAQRWTAAARQRIRSSRVDGTRALVAALGELRRPPPVLVSISAVGYYGADRGDEILTEASSPGADFLAEVAIEWERAAVQAEQFGVRVVTPRVAMVLGRNGGALKRMLPPFRLGAGGRIGDGMQWMSWIHIEDLLSLISFALVAPTMRGAVNAASPNPVRNGDFTHSLAKALHRPAMFVIPKLALRIAMGEMAEIVYGSQRVVPEATLGTGFEFKYREIGPALKEVV